MNSSRLGSLSPACARRVARSAVTNLHATAGKNGIIGLLGEPESACSKNLAESTATDECARLGQNSRIHCGVTRLSSSNSSCVSSHACVSYLDALLAAPARAPAALTAARRVAPFSAVDGLGMHDDGSSVHDACSNSWSDTLRGTGSHGHKEVKSATRNHWIAGMNVSLSLPSFWTLRFFMLKDLGMPRFLQRHATAGESEEIIGLHVSHSSFDNSSNSLGCVAAAACARLPAVPSVSARVCPVSSSSAVSAAVAHARSTPMHVVHNSCSDTGRVEGPHGKVRFQRWCFWSGRRFASCLRGGGRGKFSAGRRFSGAGCRFTSQEATRHRCQAGQGRCGHTFPPPRGSWYPIRVTWERDWTSGN